MSIYVDGLQATKVSPTWWWPESCHLFADDGNIEQLHRFARDIGLKRVWFQDGKLPHYDLNFRKRRLAIKHGARQIDRWQMREILKARRALK